MSGESQYGPSDSDEVLDRITTTTQVGDQGRLTIPQEDREALGIEGKPAYVELEIRPLVRGEPSDENRGGVDE